MEFTPQQMGGYKGYSPGVLIGNWSEDQAVRADKMQRFRHVIHGFGDTTSETKSAGIGSASTGGHRSGPQLLGQRVSLGAPGPNGALRFGQAVMIKSHATSACIALDTAAKYRPRLNHACVSAVVDDTPVVRSVWVLHKAKDDNNAFFDSEGESSVVHYGQYIRIVNEYAGDGGYLTLCSSQRSASTQSRASKRQEVSVCYAGGTDCLFVIEQSDGRSLACPMDGHPVRIGDRVVLRHKATNVPLVCEARYVVPTSFGGEIEIAAHQAKIQSTNTSAVNQPENFFTFVGGAAGAPEIPFEAPVSTNLLHRVKQKILSRGSGSIGSLTRTFRIFNTDGNRYLCRRELKDGMELYGAPLSTAELDIVFKTFDRDGNGGIDLTEFLREIRGSMNARREGIVVEAFKRLDLDGSGVAELEELKSIYGANLHRHPQVVSGARTPDQVLLEFAASWDGNRDGRVTLDEFIEYYNSVSALVDDDDYFELMVRNAWHIDGGEGQCANTANRRVLVTHTNGRQEVVGIKNDLGLGDNIQKITEALRKQGVTDIKQVDLTG